MCRTAGRWCGLVSNVWIGGLGAGMMGEWCSAMQIYCENECVLLWRGDETQGMCIR